jgi:2-polyprenyl-6-hydroxyphenyl methylase/3-demethylubiquinone-9 3-methyltransferase
MAIGAFIRRLFGRHEHRVAEAYRRLFIDLDALVEEIRAARPRPARILEVGCGEGAMTERLVAAFPGAELLAIDVTPRLGRLYRGDPARVVFRQVPVQRIAAEQPGRFDLVLLCDVLHHVPPVMRPELLAAIRATLAPGGAFVFKDWAPSRSLPHWMCETSDRVLTGDDVAYLPPGDAAALLGPVFSPAPVVPGRRTVPPHANNYILTVTAPG